MGLQDASLTPSAGVVRLTRKSIPVEEAGYSIDLDMSEVGGNAQIRPYWGHYIKRDIRVVAFFVASSSNLQEQMDAFSEVFMMVQNKAPSTKILLVASQMEEAGEVSVVQI